MNFRNANREHVQVQNPYSEEHSGKDWYQANARACQQRYKSVHLRLRTDKTTRAIMSEEQKPHPRELCIAEMHFEVNTGTEIN